MRFFKKKANIRSKTGPVPRPDIVRATDLTLKYYKKTFKALAEYDRKKAAAVLR